MKYGCIALNMKMTNKPKEQLRAFGIKERELRGIELVHFTKVYNEKQLGQILREGIDSLLRTPGNGLSSHNVQGIRAPHTHALMAADFISANAQREEEIRKYQSPKGTTITLQDLPTVFSVYAFTLDPKFANKRRFKEANPNYQEGKPVLYVGTTSKSLEERFQEHTDPAHPNYRKGARLMHEHGLKEFRTSNAERTLEGAGLAQEDLTYGEALANEHGIIQWLRAQGYGVMVG